MIESAKKELAQLSLKKVDSLIAISKNDTTVKSMFKSREDFDFQLGNLSLILTLDSEIIDYFNKNKVEFGRFKDIGYQQSRRREKCETMQRV